VIYRPILTSVVPDNTTCLVVASADVFVVTPQHTSFFGRDLSSRSPLPSSFFPLLIPVPSPKEALSIDGLLVSVHSQSFVVCFAHRVEAS
jgi:hypothetical protein